MKTCRLCKRELPDTSFPIKGNSKTIYAKTCKDCYLLPMIMWSKNNPEKRKETAKRRIASGKGRVFRLLSRHNILINDYNKILESQSNKCAICGSDKPDGKYEVFNVDHDHKTGKIRGLLCGKCNRALGFFKDNIEILQNAIKYLSKDK